MTIAKLAVFLSVVAPAALASPVVQGSNVQNIHQRQAKAPPGLGPRPQTTAAPAPVLSVEDAQARGCTYTTKAVPTAPPCRWDGTMTIYATTAYASTQVDCRGCTDVAVVQDTYPCPNKSIEDYKWVPGATTCWNTVCAPSSTATADKIEERTVPTPAAAPQIEGNPELLRQRDDAAAATATACATTLVLQPPKTAGKTLTQYAQTSTKTVNVNCGGCSLVVSTAMVGYGPPAHFTTTTTAPLAVETAYRCQ